MVELLKSDEYLFIIVALVLTSVAIHLIMQSYLLTKKAIDRSIWVRYLPSELVFRFRDYTKKHNSKLHYLYYLELVAVGTTILMAIPKIIVSLDFNNIFTLILAPSFCIIFSLGGYVTYLHYKEKYY